MFSTGYYRHKIIAPRIKEILGTHSRFKELISVLAGNPKFQIHEVSMNIRHLMGMNYEAATAQIIIKPKGIIISIQRESSYFTWIIPFYQLYMYEINSGISIHAQGKYINLLYNKMTSKQKQLLKRIEALKKQFDLLHPHIDDL